MTTGGKTRRVAIWSTAALFVGFGIIQLVPVDRTNPPAETEVPLTADARSILRRACYDCHSNETIWPAYSRVAPISWVVARDVHKGREELNFSTWNRLTSSEQRKALRETWDKVEEGKMPPRLYLPAHPEARLSHGDRAVLHAWSLAVISEELASRSIEW